MKKVWTVSLVLFTLFHTAIVFADDDDISDAEVKAANDCSHCGDLERKLWQEQQGKAATGDGDLSDIAAEVKLVDMPSGGKMITFTGQNVFHANHIISSGEVNGTNVKELNKYCEPSIADQNNLNDEQCWKFTNPIHLTDGNGTLTLTGVDPTEFTKLDPNKKQRLYAKTSAHDDHSGINIKLEPIKGTMHANIKGQIILSPEYLAEAKKGGREIKSPIALALDFEVDDHSQITGGGVLIYTGKTFTNVKFTGGKQVQQKDSKGKPMTDPKTHKPVMVQDKSTATKIPATDGPFIYQGNFLKF